MNALKACVENILRNAHNHKWRMQGLGMLRTNLNDKSRLHVWHADKVIPDVSDIHDHPWDFKSVVVVGSIRQSRFIEAPLYGETYNKLKIVCGGGACSVSPVEKVLLAKLCDETIFAGEEYTMLSDELHRTIPESGTVTIVERVKTNPVSHANVYWQSGEWVSAEPRDATFGEINFVVDYSLQKWFNS